jgi:HEPN/RES N-terminal domain 1/RES domain
VGIDDVAAAEWERGWHRSDKFICMQCVGDDYLQDVVARAVTKDGECSFCGGAPATEFDVFMEAFMVGVHNRFEQADDAGMPWEGGYVFETLEHYEIPDRFDWVAVGDHDVAVVDEISDRLAEKTYASRWWLATEPDKALFTAWKDFRDQILHRTRFVFWARKDMDEHYLGAGDVSVAKVLEAIGRLLISFDLVTTLPAGTVTYRARGHARQEDSQGWGAAELGTNLLKNATNSSRMSPAGIPLFYGAGDIETALAEVARADDREFFTAGKFVTTEPVTVIDLTHVPPVPSIFDPVLGGAQGQLRFLNELVDELRQPIDTVRSNLDYVPTQVFCEYFLHVFNPDEDAVPGANTDPEADAKTKVSGLMWTSAAAADGGDCLALHVPQEDCVDVPNSDPGRLQLHLEPRSVTTHRRRSDEFRPI